MRTHAKQVVFIEEWEIPNTERPLWKIALAAQVDSSDSDNKSGVEQADLPEFVYSMFEIKVK